MSKIHLKEGKKMKNQQTKQNKKTKYKFTKGGFYAVIAACIIALGFTSLSAYNSISTDKNNDSKAENNYTAEENGNNTVEKTEIIDNTSEQTEITPAETEISEPAAVEAEFFIMPVTGEILKNFSLTELQYSETYCDLRIHPALDVAADKGTNVTASGEGTVTSVENSATHGNTVTIDHGNGITAKYCGLSEKLNVAAGDVVNSETVIGTVGDIPAESVEKPHFHFEMYKNDEAISPLVMFGME